MRSMARTCAAVGTVVLLAASAATAAPELTITSPTSGAAVSRTATPTLSVAGTTLFDEPEPSLRKFYLRRSQCASGNDDARLDIKKGSGEQTGCAYLAQPANQVLHDTGQGALSTTYPADGGVPFTLDATKPIKGELQVSGGIGQAVMVITLTGSANGEAVEFGQVVDERILTTTSTVKVEWQMQPNAALDKADVADLALDIVVRGYAPNYGAIRHNGLSFFTVPTYTASFNQSVEYAIDSPTFAAKKVATLAADRRTWSAAVPTPAIGTHTLYARAVQGDGIGEAVSVPFTVTQ
jgi:hypothetical protein